MLELGSSTGATCKQLTKLKSIFGSTDTRYCQQMAPKGMIFNTFPLKMTKRCDIPHFTANGSKWHEELVRHMSGVRDGSTSAKLWLWIAIHPPDQFHPMVRVFPDPASASASASVPPPSVASASAAPCASACAAAAPLAIRSMFGPVGAYVAAADLSKVCSIAEICYRFVHNEIEAVDQYKTLLANEFARLSRASTKGKRDRNTLRRLKTQVNMRLYGKTPLEMFISIEALMLLGQSPAPDAAYRLSLERTFMGIFALYEACGNFIDVSCDLPDQCESADFRANIAWRCAVYPLTYTKTVAKSGELRYTSAPRGPPGSYVKPRAGTPVTDVVVLDFIKLLWGGVSTTPAVYVLGFETYTPTMQDRYGPHDLGSLFGGMWETVTNPSGAMRVHRTGTVPPAGYIRINVENNLAVMADLHMLKEPLSHGSACAVAAADLAVIPVVEKWMNIARRA